MLPTRIGGVVAGIFFFLAGLVGLTVIVLIGLIAATSLLGSRMGEAKSPVTTQLRGGVLLVLACLTPYFG
jgi:sorbitol-specific phosphotransferase system component IIBC